MKLVLINLFFPPAGAPTGLLLSDVARELVRRGHSVTVLTSATGGEAKAGIVTIPGVRVVRLGPAGPASKGVAAKGWNNLGFFLRAAREIARLPEGPDGLVCMTTPPFIGRLGVHLLRRRGIPYVLWCMDLYPEALAAHGWLRPGTRLFRVLNRMARLERSQASGVIALGPDMAARLSASGAKHVAEIPVWSSFEATAEAQAAARDLRRARGWAEGEVILLYSGNMGRAHDAGGFAELAERLRGASPRCRFIFAGLGPRRTEWERIGGGRFEFMPPVPEHACAAHLLAADVHLVSQRAEWTGLVVPSKFQAACSLGRPVVFSGPPESAVGTWLAGSDAGWVLPEGDSVAQAIAAAGLPDARVRAEKAANAFRLFEQRFTKAGNCASVVHRIEQALQDRI